MLSRTAENLYWLARYVERAEYLARTIEATLRATSVPKAYIGSSNEWDAALRTAGISLGFKEHYDEANERNDRNEVSTWQTMSELTLNSTPNFEQVFNQTKSRTNDNTRKRQPCFLSRNEIKNVVVGASKSRNQPEDNCRQNDRRPNNNASDARSMHFFRFNCRIYFFLVLEEHTY